MAHQPSLKGPQLPFIPLSALLTLLLAPVPPSLARSGTDYAYLAQIHLFILAHVIRRPIIVYAPTEQQDSPCRFRGVYLPVGWSDVRSSPLSPLPLPSPLHLLGPSSAKGARVCLEGCGEGGRDGEREGEGGGKG